MTRITSNELVEGAVALEATRWPIVVEQNKLSAERPSSRKARRNEGYVYLLRAESGYYKIGRTKNPSARAKTFDVKMPFRVEFEALIPTNHMVALETQLHERFAEKRLEGEWFDLTPDDVAYIKGLSDD